MSIVDPSGEISEIESGLPPGYPIQQVAYTLCFEDRPWEIRSIALWALKAYALGESHEFGQPSSFTLGKLHACVRTLELIEQRSEDLSSLEHRMQNPLYREIMDIALKGGFGLFKFLDCSSYEEHIDYRVKKSAMIAEIANFSYHYAQTRSDRKAGFTLAREFLNTKFAGRSGYSKSTITECWNSFSGGCGTLLFLFHHPDFNFLGSSRFDEHFNENNICSDRQLFHRFFSAYMHVSHVLRPQGFNSPKIELPGIKPSLGLPLIYDLSSDERLIDQL